MRQPSRFLLILVLLAISVFGMSASAPTQAQTYPAWQPNVAYSIGTQVTYQDSSHPNHLYKCQQAHTSQTGWEPPNVPALWLDQGAYGGSSATATNTSAPAKTNTPTSATKTNTPAATATTSSSDGSPYGGTAVSIPGKIEAENYNTGGEGVAYHDSDSTNQGGQYRTGDGVDIETTSDTNGGYDIGWTAKDEWEKYTVNVSTAGNYDFDFRVASAQAGSGLHLEVDGTNVTNDLAVPNTGGWQTWTDVTKSGVNLSAGSHVLRLYVDNAGYNINWINVSKSGSSATNTATFVPATNTPAATATTSSTDGSPYSGTAVSIPGKVEAENYNTGGEGVAYHDSDSTNQGGQYRTGDGVDIETTSDTNGGYDIGWTAKDEWEKYTVNVSTAGNYDFDFRVASAQAGSGLHLEVDGTNVTNDLAVPNTGGWQTWTDVTKTGVNLSAGTHVLRLYVDNAGYNINWINISKSGSSTATPTQSSSSNSWTGRYFAPYVDVTQMQSSLSSMVSSSSGKYVTLAFINNGGGCSATWAGGSSMTSGYLSSDITSIRNAGGDAQPSFGGYDANELADNCSDVATLQAQYQAVIDNYHFTHLDFDVENGPTYANLDNTSANDRRNKALAALQKANSGLFITFTVPAGTSGLQQNGINLLNNAVSNGVNVGAVNIMVMDYGTSGTEMGDAAKSAGNALEGQLANIFTGKSSAQLWQMVGLTPMIGQNDSAGEIFTLSDASSVLSYAQSNNIRELAFWSLSRDNGGCAGSTSASSTCSGVSQSAWQFSGIFKPFTQ